MLLNIEDWQIAALICNDKWCIRKKNQIAKKISWLPETGEYFSKNLQKSITNSLDLFCNSFFYQPQQIKVFFLFFQKNEENFYLFCFHDIGVSLQRMVAERSIEKIKILQKKLRQTKNLLQKDELTGLYSRYYWNLLVNNFSKQKFSQKFFCLLFIDVDNFKRYNDDYGHLAGDKLLQEIAESIQKNIQNQDIAIRYGGDEFVVIAKNTSAGEVVAQKICRVVSNFFFNSNVSVSIGKAIFPENGQNLLELFEFADKDLYLSKKTSQLKI